MPHTSGNVFQWDHNLQGYPNPSTSCLSVRLNTSCLHLWSHLPSKVHCLHIRHLIQAPVISQPDYTLPAYTRSHTYLQKPIVYTTGSQTTLSPLSSMTSNVFLFQSRWENKVQDDLPLYDLHSFICYHFLLTVFQPHWPPLCPFNTLGPIKPQRLGTVWYVWTEHVLPDMQSTR